MVLEMPPPRIKPWFDIVTWRLDSETVLSALYHPPVTFESL